MSKDNLNKEEELDKISEEIIKDEDTKNEDDDLDSENNENTEDEDDNLDLENNESDDDVQAVAQKAVPQNIPAVAAQAVAPKAVPQNVPTVAAQAVAPNNIARTNPVENKIFGDADKFLQKFNEKASSKVQNVNIDGINVNITFETGQQNITFKNLKTLNEGYIFECQNPIDSPIDIKANGQLIGKGQLIDVCGKIGVQITELL